MKPEQKKIRRSIRAAVVVAVLFAGIAGVAPIARAQALGAFTGAGSMTQSRSGHSATLLGNGNVLIAGGEDNVNVSFPFDCSDNSVALASAELYNPARGTFTTTGGMTQTRVGHTATLLTNGKVLITGGERENLSEFNDCTNPASGKTPNAELYDPSTGAFAAAGNMTRARFGHTATLLRDGRVLIAGAGSAELYDPSTGTFARTSDMSEERFGHTATLLDDGRVLFVGGYNLVAGKYQYSRSAEFYDPSTDVFTAAGDMNTGRYGHTTMLFPNGKILVAGGYDGHTFLDSAELFDLSTRSFSAMGSLVRHRAGHTASLLGDGTVLIAGGAANGTGSAELFDPAAGSFSATGKMNSFHSFHTATRLGDGRILIAGGYAGDYTTANVEIYDPNWPRLPNINLLKPARDFNGDGKPDILWRNSAGDVSLSLMNGSATVANSFIANIWKGWSIVGSGDFDGDGRADILWRETSGDVAIWLMDGSVVRSYRTLGNIWTGWSVAGVGDFDGDGKADILWHETSGNVAIWMMDGLAITSSNVIANIWTGWSIAGTGDLDGDGKADILWHRTSGEVGIWLMNGMTVASYSTAGNFRKWIINGWKVAGIADFDGDGNADVLWRDSDGNVAMWLMNGTVVSNFSVIARIWTGWSIAGAADFNSDGNADILWRDTVGNVAIWFMDGRSVSSYSAMGNVSDRMAQ